MFDRYDKALPSLGDNLPSQRTIIHYQASKPVVNSLNRETHYLSLVEAQRLNPDAAAACEPFIHCGVNFEPVQLPRTDVEATVSLPAAVSESLRNLCSGLLFVNVLTEGFDSESTYTFTTKARVSRALALEFCNQAAEVCK